MKLPQREKSPTSIMDGDKTPSEHTLFKDFVKSKLNPLDNFSIPLITEVESIKLIGNLGKIKLLA